MKLKNIFITAALIIAPLSATADNVINDDLIVNGGDGAVCIGSPCIDGEIFDFDSLRLKSETPQIRFEDTSASASFPTNDWLMGLNNSIFYVQDVDGAAMVLQMDGGVDGGVALGAGSVLVDNAISVGDSGSERRVAYVADATDPTDAVTLSQFNTFEAASAAAAAADIATVNAEITALEAEMAALTLRLNDVVTRLNNL